MGNLSEVQIDREALRHNFAAIRGLAPRSRVAAVVKANAYGHGLAEVVDALDDLVDAWQVDDIEELRAVRALSARPVWVLGYIPRASVAEAVALGGELAVYDLERLGELRSAPVHLKIDALLGRQGVVPSELPQFLDALQRAEVRVVGAYAHFANIEDTSDLSHAHAQVETYEWALAKVRGRFGPTVARHLSATSAAMTLATEDDWIRPGIGLYGLYPSLALARTQADLSLRPALRWVTHLAQVKTLPTGHPVGYGLTYVCRRETRIGIVPQGYADGVDRGLSNVGEVLIGGRRCPIIGRVAMNMFAVDLSSVPEARAEDEVVLLGAQAEERITAEEIAAQLGTIHYEVVARISPVRPRVWAEPEPSVDQY